MRRTPSIAVGALLFTLVLVLITPFALAWYASEQILRSSWYEHRTPEEGLRPGESKDPLVDYGLPFEDVSFAAIDGSTLRGWFVPAGEKPRAAVVTVHGQTEPVAGV